MSTHALIAYKNENGSYDVNAINFDGYIEGVGKMLQNHWNDAEKAKDLCHEREIRSLESDKMTTEFYKEYFGFLRKRKNITFEKLCNESGNFDYTYIFENDMWQLLDDRGTIKSY